VTSLRAERPGFDSWQGQWRDSFSLSQHQDSEAHPASCPMRTERSFPGGKAAGVWNW